MANLPNETLYGAFPKLFHQKRVYYIVESNNSDFWTCTIHKCRFFLTFLLNFHRKNAHRTSAWQFFNYKTVHCNNENQSNVGMFFSSTMQLWWCIVVLQWKIIVKKWPSSVWRELFVRAWNIASRPVVVSDLRIFYRTNRLPGACPRCSAIIRSSLFTFADEKRPLNRIVIDFRSNVLGSVRIWR